MGKYKLNLSQGPPVPLQSLESSETTCCEVPGQTHRGLFIGLEPGICDSWRQCPWLGELPEDIVRSHPVTTWGLPEHLQEGWELAGGRWTPLYTCTKKHQAPPSKFGLDDLTDLFQPKGFSVMCRRHALSSWFVWTLPPQTQTTSICHCQPQSFCSLTPNKPNGKMKIWFI